MPKPKTKAPESESHGALDFVALGVIFLGILPILASFLVFIFSPVELLLRIREFFAPWFEKNLWWIYIVSILISGLLVWGIIWIIVKTNYLTIKKEQFLDTLGRGHVSRSRSLRGWKQIQKRLASEEQNDWKLAILEADHILNEILKMSGYLGVRLEDKLDLITEAQLSNVLQIKNAHIIRDNISKDPSYQITQEFAKDVIEVYRKAFAELNLIRE
ncbi:MAG: hypothetical protein Q8R26_01160 [bacterium]|nr:hypothetical protein [bacterium]